MLLVVCALLAVHTGAAWALDDPANADAEIQSAELNLIQDGDSFVPPEDDLDGMFVLKADNSQIAELKSRFAAACNNLEPRVDVLDLGIRVDQVSVQDLSDHLSAAVNSQPGMFYVATTFYYTTRSTSSGTCYSTITPQYSYSFDVLPAMKAEYETALAGALSWVPANATDVQKAKAIHDWLVRNCVYNYPAAYHGSSAAYGSRSPWNAYGALVDHSPVCQGYSLAFIDAMHRLDIESYYVINGNHGWNRVKLNGRWYNIDVTWDDPFYSYSDGVTVDRGFNARPMTTYFLKSDAWFIADANSDSTHASHKTWRPAGNAGTDTQYDNRANSSWETYSGPAEGNTAIVDISAGSVAAFCMPNSFTYNTRSQKPAVSLVLVKPGGISVLREGADYTIEWPADTVGHGQKTITIRGQGAYSGTIERSYTIDALPLENAAIWFQPHTLAYTGAGLEPDPFVVYDGAILTRGVDYTCAYWDNVDQGTAHVRISGTGSNTTGTREMTFSIAAPGTTVPAPADISGASVQMPASPVYTGQAVHPDLQVVCGGTTLEEGVDYLVSWPADSTNAGTKTAFVCGIGAYEGYTTVTYEIARADISAANPSLSATSFTYNGYPQRPSLAVWHGGRSLVDGADYAVSWPDNTTSAGTKNVTVWGIGNYTGSVALAYEIRQASNPGVPSTGTVTTQRVSWSRLAGATAPDTMQKIAAKFGKAKVAVVTTSASYKDALAASALAGKNGGLVLMTKKGSLTPQTKTALKSSGVKTVLLLGSKANVTDNVAKQLKTQAGVTTVTRVGGTTPSQRAVAVAKKTGKVSDTVIIVTQNGYQDALSIGPYSYVSKSPIIYAETNKKLSTATVNYIKSAKYKKALIIGGPIALPASVETQLKKAGVTSITRLAGTNAYRTSVIIADWTTGQLKNGKSEKYKGKYITDVKFQPAAKNRLQPNKLAVATGQNWPDALAGAALCGKNRSVLLLADAKTAKSDYTLAPAWCKKNVANTKFTEAYVFGGTSAVQAKVWNKIIASTKVTTVRALTTG